MNAAVTPFVPYWLGGFDDAEAAAAAEPQRVDWIRLIFDAWAEETHLEWYMEPMDPFAPAIRERLSIS